MEIALNLRFTAIRYQSPYKRQYVFPEITFEFFTSDCYQKAMKYNCLCKIAFMLAFSQVLLPQASWCAQTQAAKASQRKEAAPAAAQSPAPVDSPEAKVAPTPAPIETWHVVGAGVGSIYGLGLGHPFQSRYLERGWIFTASQFAGVAFLLAGGFLGDCRAGVTECGNRTKREIGVVIYLGSRIWEMVDLWTHLRKDLPTMALAPSSLSETPLVALRWDY